MKATGRCYATTRALEQKSLLVKAKDVFKMVQSPDKHDRRVMHPI